MGDEVSVPAASDAQHPDTKPGVQYHTDVNFQSIQASFQETNLLNVNQGLQFPPADQIHVLEQYCPGFTDRVVAMMQSEAVNRQAAMRQRMQDDHEYEMRELELEDGRIKMITLPASLPLFLFPFAAIVFFAVGYNVAGLACVGVLSIPGLAALVQAVKRKKK